MTRSRSRQYRTSAMMRAALITALAGGGTFLAGCAASGGKAASEPQRKTPIRFHLASTTKLDGYMPAVDERGEELYIAPRPALTEADVQSASASHAERGSFITLMLTPDGAKKLDELTRDNLGQRLAIFVDHELVVSPLISSRVNGGVAQISGNFTRERAEHIVASLNR